MRFGYRRLCSPPNEDLFTLEELDRLARAMTNSGSFIDGPFERSLSVFKSIGGGANLTASKPATPSGYVYLAQFIAHDLSFDSLSQRHRRAETSWEIVDISSIRNKRNPLLDLDIIYGSETPSADDKYTREDLFENGSRTRLRLGLTYAQDDGRTNINQELYNDLPRAGTSSSPVIIDERNDENVIVAQTQVAFIKFHNAILDNLGLPNTAEAFDRVRKVVIKHYLAIIETDFLPRLVNEETLDAVSERIANNENTIYNPADDDRFLPLEFTAAAFRYGHSQIRDAYAFNINHESGSDQATLFHLSAFTGRGLSINERTNFRLPTSWVINWERFYDFAVSGERDRLLNTAEDINTHFSSALNSIMPMVAEGRANSLVALDLHRGRRLSLATGQQIADELGIAPESKLDEDALRAIIGDRLKDRDRELFASRTPLLFYILAEAEFFGRGKLLGPVGGRIVAEVLLRLVADTKRLILDDYDDLDFHGSEDGEFSMTELLKFIDKHRDARNNGVSEINPIQKST